MDNVELLNGRVKSGAYPAMPGHEVPGRARPGVPGGETDSRIREILWEHPQGLTAEDVGRAAGLSRGSAGRRLGALAGKGEIDVHTYGQTRVFTLPHRVSLPSLLRSPEPLVLVLSADLRVREVNDNLLAVFRLRREEIVGKRLGASTLSRCLTEKILAAIREGAGKKAGLAEFECLAGNTPYTFRARVMPLSSAGEKAGVVVTLEDVTAMAHQRRTLEGIMDENTLSLLSTNHRLLEDILRRRREEEQSRLVQASIEQAGVPALWVAGDGRFLRVNQAAAAALGYPEAELARMSFADIDLDRPYGTWETLWGYLKTASPASFGSRVRNRSGEPLPVEVKATHLLHGEQEYGLFILWETGGRRETGGATRAGEATLRAFIDANPDPGFLVDTRGRLILANPAGAALLKAGTEPLALARTSIFDAIPGKAEEARKVFREVLETGEGRIYTDEIRGHFFSTILSPVRDASGKVDRVAIFARDFTDRKRAEDALRQANGKLNLLNAVTRHDVLNDIAALGMYLSLPGGDGEALAMTGKLAPLLRSLQRKMEFTRDYADLGMKEPEWENVADAVQEGIAAVNRGGLRVELDLPALEIRADPLFSRAVANLVDNTIRHGERATRIRFGARAEGDRYTLLVEDDGMGIPEGKKELIFRRGYGRHTGFGLFLIREILAITGMTITETGEPGRGARFEIGIPPGGFRRAREGPSGPELERRRPFPEGTTVPEGNRSPATEVAGNGSAATKSPQSRDGGEGSSEPDLERRSRDGGAGGPRADR